MKDTNLMLKISTEMKERLQAEAERRGMSMSMLVRMLIANYLEKGEL